MRCGQSIHKFMAISVQKYMLYIIIILHIIIACVNARNFAPAKIPCDHYIYIRYLVLYLYGTSDFEIISSSPGVRMRSSGPFEKWRDFEAQAKGLGTS